MRAVAHVIMRDGLRVTISLGGLWGAVNEIVIRDLSHTLADSVNLLLFLLGYDQVSEVVSSGATW